MRRWNKKTLTDIRYVTGNMTVALDGQELFAPIDLISAT